MPDDRDVVIRFGEMRTVDLARNARVEYFETGRYALSVNSASDLTGAELAKLVSLPHPVFRESTVNRIREAGFDVIDCNTVTKHCLIDLPQLPTDEDWHRLQGVFDPPVPNPGRRA